MKMLALLLLFAHGTSALAVSFYVTPDVPTDLTGAGTTLPWRVVRHDTTAGTYTTALTLPPDTIVDGLHRLASGDWLLSVDAPTDLGGTTFLPADIVRLDPTSLTYSSFLCSGPLGIPPGVNVDALFLHGGDGGTLVVSYDAPTSIGAGPLWDPADLVEYTHTGSGCADWTLAGTFFDASSATPPVGSTSNVTGADEIGAVTIVTFDVPTPETSSTPFLPGGLVAVGSGGVLSSYYRDPAWPNGGAIGGLASLADPGAVPPTLRLVRSGPLGGGGRIRLSWSASCSAGAEDYGIYEGTIGSWYSHTSKDCFDGGRDGPLTEEIVAGAGNQYYLVVPHNVDGEGSYGTDSSGVERPRGSPGTCKPTQVLGSCP